MGASFSFSFRRATIVPKPSGKLNPSTISCSHGSFYVTEWLSTPFRGPDPEVAKWFPRRGLQDAGRRNNNEAHGRFGTGLAQ